MHITFFVPGQPQGKARARTVSHGGFTHSYTPKKTKVYEESIRDTYVLSGGKHLLGNVPVNVSITAVFRVPKSYTKKEKALCYSGKRLPLVKPDVDNITKAVLDALNGVAWHDDSQVVAVDVVKLYEQEPDHEGLFINIRSVDK